MPEPETVVVLEIVEVTVVLTVVVTVLPRPTETCGRASLARSSPSSVAVGVWVGEGTSAMEEIRLGADASLLAEVTAWRPQCLAEADCTWNRASRVRADAPNRAGDLMSDDLQSALLGSAAMKCRTRMMVKGAPGSGLRPIGGPFAGLECPRFG